jgi:putative hydrolase
MIRLDCHVHSIASGHAFGTVEEIARYCREYQMEGFALTDHGPAMPGSANPLYFQSLHTVLPTQLQGVRILRGVEANLLDYSGTLDLPDKTLRQLDVVIASLHDILIPHGSCADHTQALLAAARNPLVDILGHTGRGGYDYDLETVLNACRETGTMVEINHWTLKGDPANSACLRIARACRDLQVPIVISSDAHSADRVGRVEEAESLVCSLGIPEHLIINRSWQSLKEHQMRRKPWLDWSDRLNVPER